MGASRNDETLGCDRVSVHRKCPGTQKLRRSENNVDAALLKDFFRMVGADLLNNRAHMLQNSTGIDFQAIRLDAELVQLLRKRRDLRRLENSLGWNATIPCAVPAKLFLFDQRSFRSKTDCPGGSNQPGRAPSDHHDIKMLLHNPP